MIKKIFFLTILIFLFFSCYGNKGVEKDSGNKGIIASTEEMSKDKEDSKIFNKNSKNPIILHRAISSKIKSLDPIATSDSYSVRIMSQVLESLLNFDYFSSKNKLVPELADGMPEVSEDGLNYTFKIKKEVYYYDYDEEVFPNQDREVKAKDFVYSILRVSDKSLKSNGYGFEMLKGYIDGLDEWNENSALHDKGDYDNIPKGLKIIDDYTFSIKLKKPNPQLLYFFTLMYSAPIPREYAEFYSGSLSEHIIGTGAYYLDIQKSSLDSRYVFKASPNYRHPTIEGEDVDAKYVGKTLPLNDGIVIDVIEEPSTRWLKFKSGELDDDILDNDINEIIKDGKIIDNVVSNEASLVKGIDSSITYFTFNLENSTWKKIFSGENGIKVRKAFAYAIDVDAEINVLRNGGAIKAKGAIPPNFDSYDNDAPYPDYLSKNIAKAKELLAQAGYPNGDNLPELEILIKNTDFDRQYWELMEPNLKEAGFNVKFNAVDFQTLYQSLTEGKFVVTSLTWRADYPDAQIFLQLAYGKNSGNDSRYKNPEFDKLYEQASILNPPPQRTELYRKMNKILIDEIPYFFTVNKASNIIVYNWVKNYRPNTFTKGKLKYQTLE